jgi:hypothetical protein
MAVAECQIVLSRIGCAHECSTQNREEVPDQQPHHQIERTDTGGEGEWTDYEFRTRNVFAAVHADETAAA